MKLHRLTIGARRSQRACGAGDTTGRQGVGCTAQPGRQGSPVVPRWVPAHCGLSDRELADVLAKKAAAPPQEEAPFDTRTAYKAAARVARNIRVPTGQLYTATARNSSSFWLFIKCVSSKLEVVER